MFYLATYTNYQRCRRLGLERLLEGLEIHTVLLLDAMHEKYQEMAANDPRNKGSEALGGLDG